MMRTLLLSGYGISMNVYGGRLRIRNGHERDKSNPEEYVYKPKFIDLDNIVVFGHLGRSLSMRSSGSRSRISKLRS
jgi:CRISPR-associated protein Cas1